MLEELEHDTLLLARFAEYRATERVGAQDFRDDAPSIEGVHESLDQPWFALS